MAPAVTLIARPAPRSFFISAVGRMTSRQAAVGPPEVVQGEGESDAGAECAGEPEANAVLDHLGASGRYLARFVYCESAQACTLRAARSIGSTERR